MPGIDLNIKNLTTFFSMLSPMFITMYLLLDSAFNAHLKGIVFLIGLLLIQFLGLLSRPLFKNSERKDIKEGRGANPKMGEIASAMCQVFSGPYEKSLGMYKSPSDHGIFHFFTIFYILPNAIVNGLNSTLFDGWGFIITTFILAIMDFYNRIFVKNCEKMRDVIIGLLFGMLGGILWWFIINSIEPKLTYFNEKDKNKKCKLTKQQFKCSYN
jgi:hypothetical protein